MTNYNLQGWVDPGMENPASDSWQPMKISRRGELRVIDFVSEMLQEGRGFQVRVGTLATGIAAQDVIADATAEMCYDSGTGLCHIPIQFGIGIRGIATGTTLQVAVKGAAAVSTAGTAFVPLPLLANGNGASGSARAAAGAVTVAAELATTTRRLFEYEQVDTQTPATALGNVDRVTVAAAAAQLFWIGKGPACTYVQVAATTAFNLYFSHLNVIEVPSSSLGV